MFEAVMQRGALKTLVLAKRNPAMTVPRAPGPCAFRKGVLKPLALKHIANRNVILHADSARSYQVKLPGVVHDFVVHKKKRVKKNGKWVWLKLTLFASQSTRCLMAAEFPVRWEPRLWSARGNL